MILVVGDTRSGSDNLIIPSNKVQLEANGASEADKLLKGQHLHHLPIQAFENL